MFVGGKERKINSIINSNIRENKKQHLKFYQFRCFMVGEETHETTPLPRVIENYCLLGSAIFSSGVPQIKCSCSTATSHLHSGRTY